MKVYSPVAALALAVLTGLTLYAVRPDDQTDMSALASVQTLLLIPATDADHEFLARMEARAEFELALIAGQLTLVQAAAGCRDLDRRSLTFDLQRFRRHAPGETDEERYCRLVICGVAAILADQPDYRSDVVKRLEEELAGHLRAGPLEVPPPPLSERWP